MLFNIFNLTLFSFLNNYLQLGSKLMFTFQLHFNFTSSLFYKNFALIILFLTK